MFDVRRFIQIETSREGGNLTWEKLVEEAKCQERVGKEHAKFRRENGGGGTPVLWRSSLRQQTPYPGGTTNLSRDHGHPLVAKEARARSSVIDAADVTGCTGEKGTCPAWGKECGICRGKNHYIGSLSEGCSDASRRRRPTQVPEAKGKANLLARLEKQRPNTLTPLCLRWSHLAEGIVSGSEEASTSNLVTSEPSVSLSLGVQRVNSVLSGNTQSKASLHTRNVFSCDSIHNTGHSTLDQCQTRHMTQAVAFAFWQTYM